MPSTTAATVPDRARALRWRESWARVMDGFVPHLSTLEETVCRVAEAAGRPPARVLELGGGPGLLTERMAHRWPAAAVSLLDLDPVLLALARAALPGRVRVLAGDLAAPDWAAGAGAGHDLVVVVMTLHYLPPEQVRACYAGARRCLAPGGLLVVADLMPDEGITSLMSALDPAPDEAAAELAWAQWWSGVAEVPELRPLLAERKATFQGRPQAGFTAPASWHAAAARQAGFTEAGLLWRCGRYAALAAVA